MTATSDRVIDLLDGDLYAGDPVPHLRVDARARAGLLGRRRTSSGASPATTTSSRSRRRRTSSSAPTQKKGGYRPNLPSDPSIIGLDDPLHTKRRKLVNRGFTPRTVLRVGGPRPGDGHRSARRGARPRTASSSSTISPAPLPAQMIGLLLGYPHEMWPKLMDWSAAHHRRRRRSALRRRRRDHGRVRVRRRVRASSTRRSSAARPTTS